MNERLLIADDESSIANPVAYAFKREGFTVEIANDGEDTLRKIESFKPNVILLDINMPNLNGFEVIKRINKIWVLYF